MHMIIEKKELRNREFVFVDRSDAGRQLGALLSERPVENPVVLAIPSGGVPVALEMRKVFSCDFDLLIVRKIRLPWTTEAGFGAMNLDGDIVLNNELIETVRMSEDTVDGQIRKTKNSLHKRNDLFRKERPFLQVRDREVIIVDDGLASGYTMTAGIEYVRKRNPREIIVAVPTGPFRTLVHLSPLVSDIYCLNVREGFPFAVANAYREWFDLSDADVMGMIGTL